MSDSEYEEETTYVLFDMGKAVTSEFIEEMNEKTGGCRILGLEEGHPYVQIGNVTLEGEVDETIGTHLMFAIEERETETQLGAISNQKKPTLKYECSTETIIKMDMVSIVPKSEYKEKETEQQQDRDNILSAVL